MSETHTPNASCTGSFNRIDKRLEILEDESKEQSSDISSIKTSLDFVHTRLDAREEQTKAIIHLASSVEHMSKEVNEVVKIVKEHSVEINNLKNKPGSTALTYLDHAFKVLLGILLGGLATAVVFYFVNAPKP
jgi:predicted RNase H-like nuclease (RuvC/YqgF family)